MHGVHKPNNVLLLLLLVLLLILYWLCNHHNILAAVALVLFITNLMSAPIGLVLTFGVLYGSI